MTDVTIRYATMSDCQVLAAIIETVIQNIPYYSDLAKQNEISKFREQDLSYKITADRFSILLAESSNTIAGFCMSRFDDYVIWLEWFGVPVHFRKRGITDLLLRRLYETVPLRNCHKIWCDCRTDNNASIHILTKHGFTPLVTVRNHWYQQDFILWEKPIPAG